LNSEFELQVFVPFRTWLQFALSDPLGIIFDDAFYLEFVGNVELVQSDPD
jgi:hypothetical protein